LGRQRVDGFRPDQVVYVKGVGVAWILGAGGGPEEPLRHRPALRERLPAFRSYEAEIPLIGELGVGDGDLSAQSPQRLGLRVSAFQAFGNFPVDRGIDPTDEEARHACDTVDRLALAEPC